MCWQLQTCLDLDVVIKTTVLLCSGGYGQISSYTTKACFFQGLVHINRVQVINVLWYGKCFKILNTFVFLISNKMLVFRAEAHKMLVRIANRRDPDQTASSGAV